MMSLSGDKQADIIDDLTAPTSPLIQMWIKTHRCLVYMIDP